MKQMLAGALGLLCSTVGLADRELPVYRNPEIYEYWLRDSVDQHAALHSGAIDRKKFKGQILLMHVMLTIESDGGVSEVQVLEKSPAGLDDEHIKTFMRAFKHRPGPANPQRQPVRYDWRLEVREPDSGRSEAACPAGTVSEHCPPRQRGNH